MVLVFTDGHDTTSFLDAVTEIDVARRSRAAVFLVAAGAHLLPTARGLEDVRVSMTAYENDFFGRLAAATGGAVQRIRSASITHPRPGSLQVHRNTYARFLDDAFIDAFDAFRNSYVIHYTAEGVPKAGWHDVEVRVTRRGRYQVRARAGYFGR